MALKLKGAPKGTPGGKGLSIGHMMPSDPLVLRRINSGSSPPDGNAMSAIDARSFNIVLNICV